MSKASPEEEYQGRASAAPGVHGGIIHPVLGPCTPRMVLPANPTIGLNVGPLPLAGDPGSTVAIENTQPTSGPARTCSYGNFSDGEASPPAHQIPATVMLRMADAAVPMGGAPTTVDAHNERFSPCQLQTPTEGELHAYANMMQNFQIFRGALVYNPTGYPGPDVQPRSWELSITGKGRRGPAERSEVIPPKGFS